MAWKDVKVMDDKERRQKRKAEMIKQKVEEEKQLKEEMRRKTFLVCLIFVAIVGVGIGFAILNYSREKSKIIEEKHNIVFESVKGDVKVKTEFQNFYTDVAENDKIQQNSSITVSSLKKDGNVEKGKAVLTLADGSKIILYEDSILHVESLNYNKEKNNIDAFFRLEDGDAVFDLRRNYGELKVNTVFADIIPVTKGKTATMFKIKSSRSKSKENIIVRSGEVAVSDSMDVKKTQIKSGQESSIFMKNGILNLGDPETCNITLESWY